MYIYFRFKKLKFVFNNSIIQLKIFDNKKWQNNNKISKVLMNNPLYQINKKIRTVVINQLDNKMSQTKEQINNQLAKMLTNNQKEKANM